MNKLIINEQQIQNKIFTIRDQQVMLDSDLAELYQVETRVLNQAVKRNIKRFPKEFMFQLTKNEYENLNNQILISQNVISSSQHGGRRKMPYVFTEQGVSMLSAVLKSDIAIEISIKIINAFVNMRRFFIQNAELFQKVNYIEQKLLEYDQNFEKVFRAIESKELKPKQGIFYNGQIFDAYIFVNNLIKSANKSIVLIDNYIDETILTLFSKNQKVKVTIYTKNVNKQLKLDLAKYNAQYKPIEIRKFNEAHDRFMIIDDKEIYHIGASLKDLGKKWFAFSKFNLNAIDILKRLK